MPCNRCGSLYCFTEINKTHKNIFCPNCIGKDIEHDIIVDMKAGLMRNIRFPDEYIISDLKKYNQNSIIYHLVARLNWMSYRFTPNNGLQMNEFGYLAYLLKQVYQASGFSNEEIENREKFFNDINTLRDGYSTVVRAFRDVQNSFVMCERKSQISGEWSNFVEDYRLYGTEYRLCFDRCARSIICTDPDFYEEFSYLEDVLRAPESKTDAKDVNSVYEFADAWYQFIMQLRFMASSNEMIGDVYFTRLDESVTIFDLERFLDGLDDQLSPEEQKLSSEEGEVIPLKEDRVDKYGEAVFGEKWDTVRDQIIVSKQNMDAHPFLFQISESKEYSKPGSDETVTVPKNKILYPRDFARILKFQIFPMLNNEGESGHDMLKQVNQERSRAFEDGIYNLLRTRTREAYLRPEISKDDGSEIDALYLTDDELVLVEEKHFMPPIRMNTAKGIEIIDEKFDLEVFNEESENRSATGIPFPEKVDMWLDLEVGDTFLADQTSTPSDITAREVHAEWWKKDVKKYVVSNLVPTYIMKQGVRFLTDFEFLQLIDQGEDGVLYQLPHEQGY